MLLGMAWVRVGSPRNDGQDRWLFIYLIYFTLN